MERTHLIYVPFTGLGLYNGFRGNRWLKNRIEVFKEYTCRALKAQTNQDFTLWVSWRPQERHNQQVIELKKWLDERFNVVFSYNGVCFWDDKYKDEVARERLVNNLHNTMSEIMDYCLGDEILMTIQPSDDCYVKHAFNYIQETFNNFPYHPHNPNYLGYIRGYIMNYATKEISEYNPKTNPPFYTIRFKKEVFIDPKKHMDYTGPYKSHEYAADNINGHYRLDDARGFIVGTHGENISTYYDHPFKGEKIGDVKERVMKQIEFGLDQSPALSFKLGWKRYILRKLPHPIRRKIRYWFNEKIYGWIRS